MESLPFAGLVGPIIATIAVIISIKRRNRLISKTEAPRIFKQTKISIVFITLFWIAILLYAQFSLYPTLDRIYESFNFNNPFSPALASYFTYLTIITLIVFTIYSFISKSIKKEFEENLSKYKEDEMIKLKDIVSKKMEVIGILMMLLAASVIFVFGILSGFYVAWLASNYLSANTQNQTTTPSPTPTPLDETANWKTYRNNELKYSIKYPQEFKVEELTPRDIVIYKIKRTDVKPPADPYVTAITIRDRSYPAYGKTGEEACSAELCNNLSLSGWNKVETRINNSYGVKIFHINLKTSEDYYLASSTEYNIVRITLGTYDSYDENYKAGGIADFILLQQILSTFRFVDNENETAGLPWKSICEKTNNKPFIIAPEKGQGLTHMGRKAVQDYINQANLLGIPDKFPSILTTQRIYAEDYIKDYLVSIGASANDNVEISCELVEIALMASTKLTQTQQENLEVYARKTIGLSELQKIQEIIERSTGGTLKPIIIMPPKSIE